MISKVFTVIATIFFTCLMGIPILIKCLLVGPFKLFHVKKHGAQPAELNDSKYGEHKYIRLKTVKLHFLISGPEDAPLMLMLHGFPEIWYSWRHQITAFQDKYRVVALDMRGYGESERPQSIKDYKMELLMKDVKLLVEALGHTSCILIGHDWGGAVTWAFANQYPEMVDKLIVLNIVPIPIWRRGYLTNIKQFFASGYIYAFFMPYLPEILCSLQDCKLLNDVLSSFVVGKSSERDVECYKYYFRQPGAFTASINYYRANLWPPPYDHDLKFPMPIKVIWGCQDKYLDLSLLHSMKQAIPHVDVTKIEDSSHWVQLDQPEKVNAAIFEFLIKNQ